MMLQALVQAARRLWSEVSRSANRGQRRPPDRQLEPAPPVLGPLRRVLLTDGVSRTLFEEYAAHRASGQGHLETGWMLLGRRYGDEAVALASLPTGADSDAGVAHIGFSKASQVLGSRIVRQIDRRLTILGVVHTHPGSLRHPSDGDYRGDIEWVRRLRGKEGIFGIGTAERNGEAPLWEQHPQPHIQTFGDLCLCWYSLREGDSSYRPVAIELVLGPDLARPLHPIWPIIEAHAERLDRLARQQAGVRFDPAVGNHGPALTVTIPLADSGDAICVLLRDQSVKYIVKRGGDMLEVDLAERRVDHGVYLLLAELAAES
jgi:hypothetical protein